MRDTMEPLQQMLAGMVSPDNETRTRAEAEYAKIPGAQKVGLLAQMGKTETLDQETRSFAYVLLRRLLSTDWDKLWPELGAEACAILKNDILLTLQSEKTQLLRKRVCDVVAEMARNILSDGGEVHGWPEVLTFLHQSGTSTDDKFKEIALVIFEGVPSIFGNQQSQYLTVIKEMLVGCLKTTDKDVRIAAVKAYTAFVCDNDQDTVIQRKFADCIPHLLKVCMEVVDVDEDDVPLQCLGDVASTTPKMLKPYLNDTCNMCINLTANREREDACRHTALEVLVSICEAAPAMMRKAGEQFIPKIVERCLAMMVELEDDSEWASLDNADIDELEESNATVGEGSLDRVACALGGKQVLPAILAFVGPLLQSQEWQQRHAGLMALSTSGEGCHKQMLNMIEQIVDTIIPYLQDPHPRVRYACCNALGQMSSDFAPQFSKKCHAKIVPGLLGLMDDVNNPRVAAHAGAALVNFSEDCPKNTLIKHIQVIMQKLVQVLELTFKALLSGAGKKLVLEQVITTIASVADTAEEHFLPFYDSVMPCLTYILQNANQPEHRLMRGKTIECVSLIGLAVGKQKFLPDATAIMQVLIESQTQMGDMEADDPQVSYMLSSWARMCKLMGKDFAQYLPLVIPAVMKAAEFKPEVTVCDDEEAEGFQSEDWTFVDMGSQQNFGIRTAGLEDKANACAMLVCYAKELKEAFAEYVEPVAKLMVPLLKFYFHDGVRTSATESLPYLLEAGQGRGDAFVVEMWHFMFPALVDAIENDPENDVCAEHMMSLSKCIELLGSGCLTPQQLQFTIDLLNKKLLRHFEVNAERNKLRADEDHDEEAEIELKNEEDEDHYVLSKVSDVVHALFFVYRENMLPYFDQLLPQLTQLFAPNRPSQDRQWGICIFDDFIEFGGPGSVKYQPCFVGPILQGLHDPTPEVRQAAAYGCGIMAMHGGNDYAQVCSESLVGLAAMVEAPNARADVESKCATENAIAAVAKILKYNASMVDINSMINKMLTWLPTDEDKEEAPHIYGYLCDLIESNHPAVLGDNNSNLPRVMFIIAEALRLEALGDDNNSKLVQTRLVNIVKQLQGNEQMFQALIQTLNEEQKMSVSAALQGS